jgi:hypothetical protein
MYRGGYEPAPFRLGGDGARESVTAEQHARACADLVASWRTAPLAMVAFSIQDNPGTVLWHLSRAPGAAAPVVTVNSTGDYTIAWANSYEDEMGHALAWVIRAATGTALDSVNGEFVVVETISDSSVRITTRDAAGNEWFTDNAVVTIYGEWGPRRTIADYGGSRRKRNDLTEHPVPYAAQIYRDLQQQRGGAYTTARGSFVHAENMALARFWASMAYRSPDRFRANLSPSGASDSLDYWSKFLKVGRRAGESEDFWRERMRVHYRAGSRPATYENLRQDCSDLLGDAFVGITLYTSDLQTPSANTYWPGINDGPPSFNIGGGTWISDRAKVTINVTQPGGMTQGEYDDLVNVRLFDLLDRACPAWVTVQWQDSQVAIVWDGDGVLWDGAGVVWGGYFDWNP